MDTQKTMEEDHTCNEKSEEDKESGLYFDDYASLDVHKIMLTDEARTSAYYNAIMSQKDYFKGKIVMDVGCGSGILSLFCAKAGAKKVYAVDASNIALLAQEIVKDNHYEDVIEVLHQKVEDVSLPNNIKVDIIVSEWMGFYLLHEGMLDSVIVAREKFLNEDGKMFPEHACMYVAPCSLPDIFGQWDEFYGFNLTSFSKRLIINGSKRPEIQILPAEELIGPELELASYNLKTVQHEELDRLSIKEVIPASRDGNYQGLCIWWKCVFPSVDNDTQVTLSTSPHERDTHWKQCVLVLPYSMEVEEDQPMAFELTLYRTQSDMRRYKIEYDMVDPDTVQHPTPCNCYKTKCILAKAFLAQIDTDINGMEEDDITEDQDTETSHAN